jgi:hypothetical protein
MLGPLDYSQGLIVTGEPTRHVRALGMAWGKAHERCGETEAFERGEAVPVAWRNPHCRIAKSGQ